MIGKPAVVGTALVLDVERFKSGFSSYDINGHAGLSVAAGTVLDVTVPVYTLAAPGQEGVCRRWWPRIVDAAALSGVLRVEQDCPARGRRSRSAFAVPASLTGNGASTPPNTKSPPMPGGEVEHDIDIRRRDRSITSQNRSAGAGSLGFRDHAPRNGHDRRTGLGGIGRRTAAFPSASTGTWRGADGGSPAPVTARVDRRHRGSSTRASRSSSLVAASLMRRKPKRCRRSLRNRVCHSCGLFCAVRLMIFTHSAGPMGVTLLLFPGLLADVVAATLDPCAAPMRVLGRPAYRWKLVSIDGAMPVASFRALANPGRRCLRSGQPSQGRAGGDRGLRCDRPRPPSQVLRAHRRGAQPIAHRRHQIRLVGC